MINVLPKVMLHSAIVLVAAARVTVHAVLMVLLVTFASALVKLILWRDVKNLFILVLFTPLLVFLFWMVLVKTGAGEVFLETPLKESDQGMQGHVRRVLTPIAFALGGLVLFWILMSRPVDFRSLSGEEPLLALAVGYFVAPLLIRKRVLARFLESLGSG